MSFSAVLLAGGRSKRMGQDKAWLPWKGRPLWEQQVELLKEVRPEGVVISCRAEQGFAECGWPLLLDPAGISSPLEAVDFALRELRQPILVLAVDLPHMRVEVLQFLVEAWRAKGRGVVFRIEKYEPLAALYTPEVQADFAEAITEKNFRLQSVLQRSVEAGRLEALSVPLEWRPAFLNTNTPEAWKEAPQPA